MKNLKSPNQKTKNIYYIVVIILLFLALIILVYLAFRINTEGGKCVINPSKYYQDTYNKSICSIGFAYSNPGNEIDDFKFDNHN